MDKVLLSSSSKDMSLIQKKAFPNESLDEIKTVVDKNQIKYVKFPSISSNKFAEYACHYNHTRKKTIICNAKYPSNFFYSWYATIKNRIYKDFENLFYGNLKDIFQNINNDILNRQNGFKDKNYECSRRTINHLENMYSDGKLEFLKEYDDIRSSKSLKKYLSKSNIIVNGLEIRNGIDFLLFQEEVPTGAIKMHFTNNRDPIDKKLGLGVSTTNKLFGDYNNILTHMWFEKFNPSPRFDKNNLYSIDITREEVKKAYKSYGTNMTGIEEESDTIVYKWKKFTINEKENEKYLEDCLTKIETTLKL